MADKRIAISIEGDVKLNTSAVDAAKQKIQELNTIGNGQPVPDGVADLGDGEALRNAERLNEVVAHVFGSFSDELGAAAQVAVEGIRATLAAAQQAKDLGNDVAAAALTRRAHNESAAFATQNQSAAPNLGDDTLSYLATRAPITVPPPGAPKAQSGAFDTSPAAPDTNVSMGDYSGALYVDVARKATEAGDLKTAAQAAMRAANENEPEKLVGDRFAALLKARREQSAVPDEDEQEGEETVKRAPKRRVSQSEYARYAERSHNSIEKGALRAHTPKDYDKLLERAAGATKDAEASGDDDLIDAIKRLTDTLEQQRSEAARGKSDPLKNIREAGESEGKGQVAQAAAGMLGGGRMAGALAGSLTSVLANPAFLAVAVGVGAAKAFNSSLDAVSKKNELARSEIGGFADLGRQVGSSDNLMLGDPDEPGSGFRPGGRTNERFSEFGFSATEAARVAAVYDRPRGAGLKEHDTGPSVASKMIADTEKILEFSRATGVDESDAARSANVLSYAGVGGPQGSPNESLDIVRRAMAAAIHEGLSGSSTMQSLVGYAQQNAAQGQATSTEALAAQAANLDALNKLGVTSLRGDMGAAALGGVTNSLENPQDEGLKAFLNQTIYRAYESGDLTVDEMGLESPAEQYGMGRLMESNGYFGADLARQNLGNSPETLRVVAEGLDRTADDNPVMQYLMAQEMGLSAQQTTAFMASPTAYADALANDPDAFLDGAVPEDVQGGNETAKQTLELGVMQADSEVVGSLASLFATKDFQEAGTKLKAAGADLILAAAKWLDRRDGDSPLEQRDMSNEGQEVLEAERRSRRRKREENVLEASGEGIYSDPRPEAEPVKTAPELKVPDPEPVKAAAESHPTERLESNRKREENVLEASGEGIYSDPRPEAEPEAVAPSAEPAKVGGDPLIDGFLERTRSQESGNDYGAVNVDTGATGAYQILPSNFDNAHRKEGQDSGWDMAYLGREMTAEEFQNDPEAQDTMARGAVADYVEQLPEGLDEDEQSARLHAAWYGGPKHLQIPSSEYSDAPEGEYPSMKAYVGEASAQPAATHEAEDEPVKAAAKARGDVRGTESQPVSTPEPVEEEPIKVAAKAREPEAQPVSTSEPADEAPVKTAAKARETEAQTVEAPPEPAEGEPVKTAAKAHGDVQEAESQTVEAPKSDSPAWSDTAKAMLAESAEGGLSGKERSEILAYVQKNLEERSLMEPSQAANVAEDYLSGQGYRDGGYTGDGAPDEVAGVVHRGELVLPSNDLDRFEQLLQGAYGGAAGTGGPLEVNVKLDMSGSASVTSNLDAQTQGELDELTRDYQARVAQVVGRGVVMRDPGAGSSVNWQGPR